MPSYRDILAASWQVVYRRPWVWLLGLFAAALVNNGEYQLFINSLNRLGNPSVSWWWPNTWTYAHTSGQAGAAAAIAVIVLLITALIIWLAVSSLSSLFVASDQILAGRATDLRSSWRNARGHFWSVLGLVAIGKCLTSILLMVAVAPLVLAFGVGGSNATVVVAGLLSFIIFVPLAIIISFATKYGIAYVVLQRQSFTHALVNGWKLFWKNWLVSMEVALILFAIGLAVSLALVVVYMVVLIIILSVNTVLGTVGVPALIGFTGFTLLRLFAGLVVLPAVLVSGAVLAGFQTAAWTLVFRHVTSHGLLPKLVRIFRRAPKAVAPRFTSLAAPARRSPRRRARSG